MLEEMEKFVGEERLMLDGDRHERVGKRKKSDVGLKIDYLD